jgi:selenocysteine lyase/cysteine desulfurase
VGPRTKLVACSHVSWITGAVRPDGLASLDVPVLLDGAQGVGAVGFDVGSLGCDFYAGSGQKWMCGPIGSGMLWVEPTWRERLAPVGATYLNLEDANAGLAAELQPDARRYDSPGVGAETLAAALAAHDVLAAHGWSSVHGRASSLAGQLAERLAERGRTVAARGETTLVSFEDADPEATRDRLAEDGVIVRHLPGTAYVRASVGAWNDEEDLERLLAAL